MICVWSSFLYAFYGAFRYDIEEDVDLRYQKWTEEESTIMWNLQYLIEFVYTIDFIMQFFVNKTESNEQTEKVTEVSQTALKYFKTNMIWDLIPLFPFSSIFTFKNSRLVYLIKCMRITKSFNLLDNRKFMKYVK